MEKLMKDYLNKLICIDTYIDKSLKNSPSGKLRCTKSHGTNQYFIDEKYVLKSNLSKAKKIAQRDYMTVLSPLVKKQILNTKKLLDIIENSILENTYDALCPGRKALVTPVVPPMEVKIKAFLAEPYEPLSFREDDNSEFITENGERVRSKSEKLIADKLRALGIPYRYEKPLTLKISGYNKTFHPDFTIMHKRTGKILYLEHLGMMDNPEYCIHAIKKIEIYEKNGYLLGDKLLITKETSETPLNTSVMGEYFTEFLT